MHLHESIKRIKPTLYGIFICFTLRCLFVDSFILSQRKVSQSGNTSNLCCLNKSLLETLCERFQGDFDNFDQVLEDRRNSLTPRHGGGHEHFHVTLIPVPVGDVPFELFATPKKLTTCACVIAGYYFDGLPDRIFRLRLYAMCEHGSNVLMKLYMFDKEIEHVLVKHSSDSSEKWLDLLRSHVQTKSLDIFKELDFCDILWADSPHPTRQNYLLLNDLPNANHDAIHAIMIHGHDEGGVLLKSQTNTGAYIRIQDELSLWEDELWVNDRGHDADTKEMVYGNWNGVPYKMKRVSSFKYSPDGKLERHQLSPNLKWTLGPKYRDPSEYINKMKSIGGVSSEMNRKQ